MVDEAVLLGLGRREPAVAVGVGLDLLHALPGVLGDELGHLRLDEEQIHKDSDRGRWFGAQDAKEYGFVDHVFERSEQASRGDDNPISD